MKKRFTQKTRRNACEKPEATMGGGGFLSYNPKTPAPARFPRVLVDLADVISLDLDDGREIRFPRGLSMSAEVSGKALWILPRKGKIVKGNTDRKAGDLIGKFKGFEANGDGRTITTPRSLHRIGKAMAIVYRSDKWTGRKRDYVHYFSTQPNVLVDNEMTPRFVALKGGKIRITARGIEG